MLTKCYVNCVRVIRRITCREIRDFDNQYFSHLNTFWSPRMAFGFAGGHTIVIISTEFPLHLWQLHSHEWSINASSRGYIFIWVCSFSFPSWVINVNTETQWHHRFVDTIKEPAADKGQNISRVCFLSLKANWTLLQDFPSLLIRTTKPTTTTSTKCYQPRVPTCMDCTLMLRSASWQRLRTIFSEQCWRCNPGMLGLGAVEDRQGRRR